ncbi:hypothetical protein KJ641_02680 [Patescibacteria group bacterium]|nr:hypothetical protein [Patescibacteria group bacterium]MBU1895750.1 hypothetical protein [Patescibacteria group bacterium]
MLCLVQIRSFSLRTGGLMVSCKNLPDIRILIFPTIIVGLTSTSIWMIFASLVVAKGMLISPVSMEGLGGMMWIVGVVAGVYLIALNSIAFMHVQRVRVKDLYSFVESVTISVFVTIITLALVVFTVVAVLGTFIMGATPIQFWHALCFW